MGVEGVRAKAAPTMTALLPGTPAALFNRAHCIFNKQQLTREMDVLIIVLGMFW
jgi:hypothetical protein